MKKTFTKFAVLFTLLLLNLTLLNAQTYFSDNFESGLGNWIVGGNNWDTLSTTYSSSNHCITDSRTGNYTYNSDPTITMLTIVNLSNSNFPVLTFWTKFSLYENNTWNTFDYAYVEISTNAGFNWTSIRSFSRKNRAWSFVQIDLKNYRTNNVKVRFRLSSHNSQGGVDDGLYVDDVSIVEYNTFNPPVIIPFSDNIGNMNEWIRGGFNWDTTSSTYVSTLFSGLTVERATTIYRSDPTITLSGVLQLSNSSLPALTFWQRYNLYENNTWNTYDYGYVEISRNGGFTWNTILEISRTNWSWHFIQLDLSNYRTDSVKIRFHLSSHNSQGGTADGWYIDDVSIRDLATGVTQIENSIPDKYSLTQNFPNPFNPSTNIMFDIPKESFVSLKVFDLLGKEYATLVNEYLKPGSYSADWNASAYPSGVYFYRLETEGYSEVKKMILTK